VAFVEAGMGIAIVDPLNAASAAARVTVKRFALALAESLSVVRAANVA
jgi:hypothetical protein